MLKTATAIGALALAFSTSAYAADVYNGGSTKDAPGIFEAPVSRSWTGLWIGALGGYQFSNSELKYDDVYTEGDDVVFSTEDTVSGLGADGLFGELQVGFDKQISRRVVLGVFGGLNLSDGEFEIENSTFVLGGTPEHTGTSILSFEQEWGGVLGARAGYLTTPDTMFFVAGGWAFGKLGNFKSDFGGSDGKGGDVFDKQETDLSGWFAELGMETRLMNNVYLTVAGRYTDYGSITLDHNSYDDGHDNLEVDHDTLAVMAGLKFKLGGIGD